VVKTHLIESLRWCTRSFDDAAIISNANQSALIALYTNVTPEAKARAVENG